jgi:type IV pilus biogenesis protein PilP
LAVPDPAEGIVETAALDADAPPPGGVSLAALRPQSRPEDLLPAALIPNPLPDEVSEQAVARSLVPSQRPRDLAARAQAALAAVAAAPAGAPEDVEEDEGESVSTASVTIPTTADVARNATETNALRLNQTNLIGVFGAANSRRALVRLSSGRVVRVSVGDQFDGGRVTAISEDALRYTSGGREQVLEIGG